MNPTRSILIPRDSVPACRALIRGSALFYVVEVTTTGATATAWMHSPSPSSGEQALWEVLAFLAGRKDARLTAPASSPHIDEDSRRAIDDALRLWHTASEVAA